MQINQNCFVGQTSSVLTDKYKLLKELGRGGYSIVYLAQHRISKIYRCVKKINRFNFTSDESESIMNEIKTLKEIDHPNVIRIIEFFQKKQYLYIVTEFLEGGELFDRICDAEKFQEIEARKIVKQILSCLSYMHSKNIAHRDIKPENIIFEKKDKDNYNLKIIDFGTSRKLKFEQEKMRQRMGTPYYIAPEVLNQDYGLKCDVWSCGIILYILLCGYPPFNGSTDHKIMKRIMVGEFSFPKEEWDYISDEAKDLISKMLVKDPKKRYSALQCLEHPWFNLPTESFIDLSKKQKYQFLDKMKNFQITCKLKRAVCLYFVSYFDNQVEKKRLLKIFKTLDKDGDGQITKKELIQSYSQFYDDSEAKEYVKLIFEKFDFNKTDAIDFTEFLYANFDYNRTLNKKQLRQMFQIMDKNGDGVISLEELSEFFHISHKEGREMIQGMINEVDGNNDGFLGFDEFMNMMTSK